MAKHTQADVARAISLFFAVRGVMRTKLAKGKTFDPTTWLRVETMRFIADHDDSRMKDVAEHLSITAPSATSLVGGLVRSGIVTSTAAAKDRRATRLALTKKGETELKTALARGTRALSGLFETLSPRELAAFAATLEHIKNSDVRYAKPGK